MGLRIIRTSTTNNHRLLINCDRTMIATSFCKRANFSPLVISKFSDRSQIFIATNDEGSIICRSGWVSIYLTKILVIYLIVPFKEIFVYFEIIHRPNIDELTYSGSMMRTDSRVHSTIEVSTYPLFRSWFHSRNSHHNLWLRPSPCSWQVQKCYNGRISMIRLS